MKDALNSTAEGLNLWNQFKLAQQAAQ